MKFFANSEKAAEKTLAETTASRVALATRLTAAQGAVAESTAALHQLAIQGADDAALAAGEAKLLEAQRRVATLAPALAEIETLLTTLESEIATTADSKQRVATNAQVAALADELVEVAGAYHASTSALNEVCSRVLAVTMEANGLSVFLTSSLIEVAAAVPIVAEVLRQHGRAVLNHQAPAKFPTPAPPAAKPVPVAPPATRHVFSVRHISWTDETGLRVQAGGFECDLPPAVAARGLKTGAVALIGSEAFRSMKGTRPITHPAPERCENLDGNNGSAEPKAEPQMQHEVIRHAAFEPIDRGPPRLMRIGGTS
jgi:hypothetical protein